VDARRKDGTVSANLASDRERKEKEEKRGRDLKRLVHSSHWPPCARVGTGKDDKFLHYLGDTWWGEKGKKEKKGFKEGREQPTACLW